MYFEVRFEIFACLTDLPNICLQIPLLYFSQYFLSHQLYQKMVKDVSKKTITRKNFIGVIILNINFLLAIGLFDFVTFPVS